jgi:hypothetical protein
MVVIGNFRSGAELRKKPRRQFHYAARIFTDQKAPLIACMLSDVSANGARIILKDSQDLPDSFLLLLTENGGPRRNCRVVWRSGDNIGVEFTTG